MESFKGQAGVRSVLDDVGRVAVESCYTRPQGKTKLTLSSANLKQTKHNEPDNRSGSTNDGD